MRKPVYSVWFNGLTICEGLSEQRARQFIGKKLANGGDVSRLYVMGMSRKGRTIETGEIFKKRVDNAA